MLRRIAAAAPRRAAPGTGVRPISSLDVALRAALVAAVEAQLVRAALPSDGLRLEDFAAAAVAAQAAAAPGARPRRAAELVYESAHGVEMLLDGRVALRDNRRLVRDHWRALAALPDAGLAVDAVAAMLRLTAAEVREAAAALQGSWATLDGDTVRPLRRTAAERGPAVRLLRRVLLAAPPRGVPTAELGPAVRALAAKDGAGDEAAAAAADAVALLDQLPQWHFTHGGVVYFFDWDGAADAVWAQLPPEGVPASTVQRWFAAMAAKAGPVEGAAAGGAAAGGAAAVAAAAGSWLDGGELERVLLRRYQHLFLLRRPRSPLAPAGTVVVSPRGPSVDGSLAGELAHYAAHVGTSAQWLDLDAALATLSRPSPRDYGGASWVELVAHSRALDVDVRRLVRPRPDVRRVAVFVDGSAVAPAAAAAALAAHGVAAPRDVAFTATARREAEPPRDGENVVGPAWVPNAALLAARAALRRGESPAAEDAVVVCGRGDGPAFKEAFADGVVTVLEVSE